MSLKNNNVTKNVLKLQVIHYIANAFSKFETRHFRHIEKYNKKTRNFNYPNHFNKRYTIHSTRFVIFCIQKVRHLCEALQIKKFNTSDNILND